MSAPTAPVPDVPSVHDPVAVPEPPRGDWAVREPGTPYDEPSWTGIPVEEASDFQAPEATQTESSWSTPPAAATSSADPARLQEGAQAEAEGRWRDALLIYQELSFLHPDDTWLSDRVALVAGKLSASQ
ncbi:MAG: hypothetical protein AB8I08_12795 [Sandaracinaceae bacterium]